MPNSRLSKVCFSLLLCGCALCSVVRIEAANLAINYRGKAILSSAAVNDQTGDSFNIHELSGVTFRGGSSFTAVGDENGKLVNFNVAFNADGSMASNTVTGGISLPENRDYEGIAFTGAARNSVFISNESNSPAPAIYEYSLANPHTLLQTVNLPTVFQNQRDNRGLEALTRRSDGTEMWTANEEALTVDGPASSAAAGTVVRLQRLAVSGNTVTPAQQFAYVLDPIHSGMAMGDQSGNRSGLSDLVELPDGTLLALERSGISGLPPFRSRIYQIHLTGATDISLVGLANGLHNQNYTPVSKTLLIELTNIGENFEGLCLGPQLANGNFSLLGVVDDGDPVSANTLVALELVITSVPEPQAWLLAAGGGAGLAVLFLARRMLKRPRAAV